MTYVSVCSCIHVDEDICKWSAVIHCIYVRTSHIRMYSMYVDTMYVCTYVVCTYGHLVFGEVY